MLEILNILEWILLKEYLKFFIIQHTRLGISELFLKIFLESNIKEYEKLKNQSIDFTFIINYYRTEMVRRNKYYNTKNDIQVYTTDDKIELLHL